MDFDIQFDFESSFRLFLSFIIGTAIGLEREYRSKAAGLRTMIMICLGATLFTEISVSLGGPAPDRIASTVVTGIGFLGAGVIFRDGLTVSGITTATTIWISAALGMAVGVGEYFLALSGSVIVLVVLTWFEKVKLIISRRHQARTYRIEFDVTDKLHQSIDEKLKSLNVRFLQERHLKKDHCTILVYEVFGKERLLEEFNNFLKENSKVISYEY